jgi:hypothetical protein
MDQSIQVQRRFGGRRRSGVERRGGWRGWSGCRFRCLNRDIDGRQPHGGSRGLKGKIHWRWTSLGRFHFRGWRCPGGSTEQSQWVIIQSFAFEIQSPAQARHGSGRSRFGRRRRHSRMALCLFTFGANGLACFKVQTIGAIGLIAAGTIPHRRFIEMNDAILIRQLCFLL